MQFCDERVSGRNPTTSVTSNWGWNWTVRYPRRASLKYKVAHGALGGMNWISLIKKDEWIAPPTTHPTAISPIGTPNTKARVVMDIQHLNNITVPDIYPQPLQSELLQWS